MSYYNPGVDSAHIKNKLCYKAKTLNTFANEKPIGTNLPEEPLTYLTNKFPFDNVSKAKKMVIGKTTEEILNTLGIEVKKSSDGSKILTHFEQPGMKYTFKDIGVEENSLIKGVSKILGNFNLRNTSLESTEGIKTVQGDIILAGKNAMKDMSSLKNVFGSVLVEASSDDEAKAILKKVKFNPERFGGKIIRIFKL